MTGLKTSEMDTSKGGKRKHKTYIFIALLVADARLDPMGQFLQDTELQSGIPRQWSSAICADAFEDLVLDLCSLE